LDSIGKASTKVPEGRGVPKKNQFVKHQKITNPSLNEVRDFACNLLVLCEYYWFQIQLNSMFVWEHNMGCDLLCANICNKGL
jgi:hypothetical protein